MEAKFYSLIDGKANCNLCPHRCKISDGHNGICQVRRNENGHLLSLNYGVVSAMALDPIEKKPLYHFYPGSSIFSIGSIGCNFRCPFCQNHTIANASSTEIWRFQSNISPHTIFDSALETVPKKNIGVAYTYNEPTVWYEFMYDIAKLVSEAGMKNVVVSNGYIEQVPLHNLLPLVDAFNIDLKGSSAAFYKKMTGGTIQPVLSTLKTIKKAGCHLEIAYLVIPEENDNPLTFKETVSWIRDNLGLDIVLHINRYFPSYKMEVPPTAIKSLIELYNVAKEILPYVYLGNTGIPEYNNSYCPKCGNLLVERKGMHGTIVGLTSKGSCSTCGTHSHFLLNFK